MRDRPQPFSSTSSGMSRPRADSRLRIAAPPRAGLPGSPPAAPMVRNSCCVMTLFENLLMSRMSIASGGESCTATSRAAAGTDAVAHLAGPGAALPFPQRAEHRGKVVSVLERAEVDGAFAAGESDRRRANGCSSGRRCRRAGARASRRSRLRRRARCAGTLSPATSGTTITRATFETGSGTNVIAIDLKFTSNASGPTLYARPSSPSNSAGSCRSGSKKVLSSTTSPRISRIPKPRSRLTSSHRLFDDELGIAAAAHVQIRRAALRRSAGASDMHLRAERERRP